MSESIPQLTIDMLHDGAEGYVRYAGGVALLHDPDSDFSQSMLIGIDQTDPESSERIVIHAEDLMLSGLRTVVARANSTPSDRGLAAFEHRYYEARSGIQSIVSEAYKDTDRLDLLGAAVAALRPNPLRDISIYKALCHGRMHKLHTVRLMDGILPHDYYRDLVAGRTLQRERPGQPSPLMTGKRSQAITAIL
jgi:hypothetical protein